MPEKAESWRLECDKEMLGEDPNIATNEDIFWNQPDRTTSTARLTRAFVTDALIAQIGFLKLLVRLRRVILQDAVLFLIPNDDGLSLSNPLLESLPEIFKCRLFVDFQHDLMISMDAHRKRGSLVHTEIPVNAQTMATAINNLAQQSSAVSQKVDGFTQEMKGTVDRLAQVMNRKVDRLTETFMEVRQEATWRTQFSQEQPNAARQPPREEAFHWLSAQPILLPHQNCTSGSSTFVGPSASTSNNQNLALQLLQVVLSLQQQPQQQQQQPQQQPQQQQQPQPQQQQQQQEQEQSLPLDPKIRGYIMRADSKQFTIQEMWDEFHGPVSEAKKQDPAWPYTSARSKLFRRRRQLVELLKQVAQHKDEPIEKVVNDTSERCEGVTVNVIRLTLLAEKKEKHIVI